jgi:hypothetical protein
MPMEEDTQIVFSDQSAGAYFNDGDLSSADQFV